MIFGRINGQKQKNCSTVHGDVRVTFENVPFIKLSAQCIWPLKFVHIFELLSL